MAAPFIAPTPALSPTPARQPKVRELDFRRPSKFTRDQIRQLERAHETFCRSVSSRLSAELRDEFAMALLGTDQLPYAVAMDQGGPRDALVTVLDVDPIGTQVALICDMAIAHAFVNRLLGGEDLRSDAPVTLTDLELSVVGCALGSLVESMSTAWTEMAGLSLRIARLETSPTGVELVPPSEPTLLVNLTATLGRLASPFTVVLPHPALAAVLPSLDRNAFRQDELDPEAPQTMQRAVGAVDVTLRAEVGAIGISASEVLRLGPGDVIRLGRPAAAGALLCVDDVAVCTAKPGRNGAARAVQVTAPVERPL
ncbi:MAG: FliM/FliN family flagellar motor switch protein [Actinomycetota bacterium]|nr:FliM/FliN family flagellar motor switch protein [Actinomycetota bacterium]